MQQLELQQQEYAASREAALKELTDKISSILKQYFGQHISEADAILRMAELGVDIDPAAVRYACRAWGGLTGGGRGSTQAGRVVDIRGVAVCWAIYSEGSQLVVQAQAAAMLP
jgi:hypothetical protein